MRINSIAIENYKGFHSRTNIQFHPKLNVFIGSNASGKTTVLTAILKCLYQLTSKYATVTRNSSKLKLQADDVNYFEQGCFIIADVCRFNKFDGQFYIPAQIEKVKNNSRSPIDLLKVAKNSFNGFKSWFDEELNVSGRTIPIIKYYAANTGLFEFTGNSKKEYFQISQLSTWANIYQDDVSFNKFFEWFYQQENDELRLQRDENNFKIENPQLNAVRIALRKAFELLGYFNVELKSIQKKQRNTSSLIPALVLKSPDFLDGEDVSNKSDGEKAIISLIADIAYNLSIAKDYTFNENVLDSPGIVMIDEVEKHLHPNWQRQIIPLLTQIFPEIQFFIATHSPQVISSVKSESVFSCQDFVVEKVGLKTYGEDTNALLKYIFNASDRPKEYITLLEKFHKEIESNTEYALLESLIAEVALLEKRDNGQDIDSLVEHLKLELDSYKFDKEYEADIKD